MVPKGKLLIIGGAEDMGEEDFIRHEDNNNQMERLQILKNLLSPSKKKSIEIITTGTLLPEELKLRYLNAFTKMNYPIPNFLYINNRLEAYDKVNIERIKKAGAIFFTGGDQIRLATILGNTPILSAIHTRYIKEKNFLVAGTSAGAMVMSAIMIISGGYEALLKRRLKIMPGFGLIQNCIIDTHFLKRGRFERLAHAIILNPTLVGIGLCEDAALIIRDGFRVECCGSGIVVIIDGKKIGQTNITKARKGIPISVENLKVHLLGRDGRFSIKTGKLISSTRSNKKNSIYAK